MKSYTVQEGENVITVAQKFGVGIADLVRANNLKNQYFLTPGTNLIIPITMPGGFEYYTVKKGDTLYSVALDHNITANVLAELNAIDPNEYIHPGEKIIVPMEEVKVYITKEGDRLNDVAKSLNVLKEELVVYNPNLYLLPSQIIAYRSKKKEGET